MLQQHLALATAIGFAGFLIALYGQLVKSRTLILIGLAIIAVISLLVILSGNTVTGTGSHCCF
jgi:predicted ABC-type exoprotein transport system permease subunit